MTEKSSFCTSDNARRHRKAQPSSRGCQNSSGWEFAKTTTKQKSKQTKKRFGDAVAAKPEASFVAMACQGAFVPPPLAPLPPHAPVTSTHVDLAPLSRSRAIISLGTLVVQFVSD